MKEMKTEIIINAEPEQVWTVLMDFKSYPDWNPFIKSISGGKTIGSTLIVKMSPPDVKEMTLKPILLKLEENKELRWKGKLIVKGIFDGEHYFILSKQCDGKTKFIQGEKFSGILVSLTGKIIKKTKMGFELMNQALKRECEK